MKLFRYFLTLLFIFTVISCSDVTELPSSTDSENKKTDHVETLKHSKPSSDSYKREPLSASRNNNARIPSPGPGHGGGTGESHPDIKSKVPENSRVVIPALVKNKWKGVKLIIEDKTTNSVMEHRLLFGDKLRLKLAGSQFDVVAEVFLPDFRIEKEQNTTVYTSVSANPENPAVKIHVYEHGTELFDGWLFSMFPSMYPFKNDKIGITFKQGLINNQSTAQQSD